MSNVTVIGGNASGDLARRLARKLKAGFVGSNLRVFPDGEGKVTLLGKPKSGKIIVVNSTYPPVDSNLVYTLALISKASEYSNQITAVIPYLGYARQDREFLAGEVVTLSVIADLLKAAGASKMIVVDIHSQMGMRHFKIPIRNVSAIEELARYFKKMHLKDPLVVSPDSGGAKRAEIFAGFYGTKYIALKKQRDRRNGKVRIITSELDDVRGRDLILVDDMISTGGSIVKATEFLKKQKCRRVFVACTHALLIGDAERKIRKAGVTQIVSTNTIPGKTAAVDVAGIIAKAI
ncbi:MAG: ribose-phosphate pyrophosphokinase [Candidatus Nitrosotenuis sp.]|uniref:Ribose-phosphate pyrophosphokinase n=1 Tax=Candidatus Nitrosotenuis uzonensis TaxID=1407055 RepID=A0A812F0H4_9ARCH|nr:ribose-phosphate pyrophosphokinase [Candidatus Nitrosotenuis uzonensis]CAE6489092.1 putative phosphoribosyl transferase domain protein [Candidatus Nitrosotenuis uzonensis]